MPNYKPALMRFIDSKWNINTIHEYLMRINNPVLFRFEAIKAQGIVINIQHHLPILFNPIQTKLPIFQQDNDEVHESQHTLTLPTDS